MHRGIRFVAVIERMSPVAARSLTERPYASEELRFNAERPLRKHGAWLKSQLILSTAALSTGIHVANQSPFPNPPSYPSEDGAGPQAVRPRPSVGPSSMRARSLGFVTMVLHSVLSGTDLTSPVIAFLSWASAIGSYTLERFGRALRPARIRA